MEALIKLNDIINKVTPNARLVIDGRPSSWKNTIYIKPIKPTVQLNESTYKQLDYVDAYFHRIHTPSSSMATPVKMKKGKFIFNLHNRGALLHVSVKDDGRMEEILKLIEKGYTEAYNLEDYRLIFNNLKKSKRVTADIKDDKLDISIQDDTVLSLDKGRLRELFDKGEFKNITSLGSSKKKKKNEQAYIRERYIDILLACGIEKGSDGNYNLPISSELNIPVEVMCWRHDSVVVEFRSPCNEYDIISGAMIVDENDMDKLVGIINEIVSETDKVNRFVKAVRLLLGYTADVIEYNIIISNGSNMSLSYDIHDYPKFFNDLKLISRFIDPDAKFRTVQFRGNFEQNYTDIISGEKYLDRVVALDKSTEGCDLDLNILNKTLGTTQSNIVLEVNTGESNIKITEVIEDGE